MCAKQVLTESLRPEPTLQEELAALGEDDLLEFMNLTPRQTGIDGTVFVSTARGPHGPRVKYFVKAGKDQPSFSVSISVEPRVLASSLPERVVRRVAPEVINWVKLNRADLERFWNEGETWTLDEVHAFGTQLKKLSSEKE
jgi:hypothetical protein